MAILAIATILGVLAVGALVGADAVSSGCMVDQRHCGRSRRWKK